MSAATETYDVKPGFADALLKKMATKTGKSIIMNITEEKEFNQCKGITRGGSRCGNAAKIDDYCGIHAKFVNEDGEYTKCVSVSKRATNPYLEFKKLFGKENPDEGAKLKEMKFGERQSYYSSKWKSMSATEKKPYEDIANEAKEEFYKKNPKMKKKREKKRSENCYLIFKREMGFTGTFKEIQAEASAKWKSMTDEEKEPYRKKARDKKSKFDEEKSGGLKRPSRIRTCYNFWMMENDSKIRSENKGLSFKELGGVRSKEWALTKTDAKEMKRLQELVEKDRIRFSEEKKTFIEAGGVWEKKKKNKKKEPMPKELLSDLEEDVESVEEEEDVEILEFTTTQKSKYTELFIDPNTKRVFTIDDKGEVDPEHVGVAESVEMDGEDVSNVGHIHWL